MPQSIHVPILLRSLRRAVDMFCVYSVCCCVVSAVSAVYLPAQSQSIDSLQKVLARSIPDSVRVTTLNELAFQVRKSNPTATQEYTRQAQKLAEKIGFMRGVAESYRILGIVARIQGKYDSAIIHYEAAIRISERIDDKRGMATALNNIAIIFSNQGNEKQAITYYSRSLGIKESVGDTLGIINVLNNIGEVYYEQGLFEEARQYYERALPLARIKNDLESISLLLVNIGSIMREKGDFTRALAYFREAQALREIDGDRIGVANVLRNMGDIYRIQGSRALAMESCLKALKIAREIGDKEVIAKTLRAIGVIYEDERNFVVAIEHYTQALGLFREIGYKRGIYESLHALGSVYDEQMQYEVALDYYRQSLAMKRVANDRKGIAMSLNNMGYIFERQKDYTNALDHYKQALTLHQGIGNVWGMAAAYTNIASIYRHLGNYAEAERMGFLALEAGEKEQAVGFLHEISGILADMYEKSGNYPKALEFHKRMATYQDSLTKRTRARELAKLSVEYDVERKQTENALLKRDAEIQQATVTRQYILIVAGGVGLLLLVTLAVVLFRSNTSRKRANTRLTDMNAQLEQSFRNVENLNDIARAVSSTLDLEEILATVYQRVNAIMDATIFGLGLYQERQRVISYRLVMNKGQRLEPYERSIEDKNQFAVWCLEHEKEVFINDVEQEYHQYIPSFREKILVKGETEMPQSLLYVPIQVQSRTLGVLSVQTPLKGAYTRYHLEMLRAIASYTASALNNAEAFGEIQRQQVLLSQQATDIELANTALQEAHEESETLLKNILPEEIALRLKFGERAIADHYDSVTVLFADIVGFTNLSAHVSAKALVEGLNRIFAQFDALTKEYGVEKIKTIGDAYMVAGGLPARTDDHCTKIASLALAMQNVIKGVVWTGNNGENIENKVQLRIGIHTGEAVAGVIGTSKFAYDLWGNTVNTASRMESHGEAGKIHISEEVYRALQEGHSSLGIGHSSNDNTLHQSSIDATYNINDQSTKTFLFEERGEIEVKGKGMMRTYFLTGVNDTKLS